MTSISLTSGAIANIAQGLADLQPVLQVLEIRLVHTQQSSKERYRMILSDGIHNQQAMLATQFNGIVESGMLQKGSIVQLNEFICNTIQNRRIVIVLSLQVLVERADVIGESKNYDLVNPMPQNRPIQPSGLNQTSLSINNVQHHVGSQAIGPDAQQLVIEDSTIPRQEFALNNQSAESLFSEAGQRMASLKLTIGAIAKISEGVEDKLQPILLVLDIQLATAPDSSVERYRVLLSDGVQQLQGMLATQLNGIVQSGQLQKGSIVQLTEFVCSTIQCRRFIIVLDLQVLILMADMIGNPSQFDASNQPGYSIQDYVGDQMVSLSI